MRDDEKGSSVFAISLPKPQAPLPEVDLKERYDNHIDAVIKGLSRLGPPPTHAWVRTVLCVGYSVQLFPKTYSPLSAISECFGKCTVILPAIVDHHEIEQGHFEHICDPITGDYEAQVHWVKNRVHGGTHFLLAVESHEKDGGEFSENLVILDSIESLLRMCLGANSVIHTRSTKHIDLRNKSSHVYSPNISHYAELQVARSDQHSLSSAIDLAKSSCDICPKDSRRVALGLRWANQAFKQQDLLSFWTAIEILANFRGIRTYPVIAEAYGLKKSEGQRIAKKLLINELYELRGDLVHGGIPINLSLLGTSFLLALTHDLARHATQLPPMKFAESVLGAAHISDLARKISL
ncbi:MAG: hypothetical protein V4673_03350 [Pseudomonadota bacterium]